MVYHNIMPKIPRNGSTMKQMAYARRIWGAKGTDKQHIALDVGYSPYVSRSASSKIEATKGFNNAMVKLAKESNNMALEVLGEFKSRGLKDFSNKDLVGALNAIGGAWTRFNAPTLKVRGQGDQSDNNRLRAVILQQVENQTINTPASLPKPQMRNVLDVMEEEGYEMPEEGEEWMPPEEEMETGEMLEEEEIDPEDDPGY